VQAQGRAKLGVEAFAEALLGFVKILAENSGWVLALIKGPCRARA
jgi:chaperonin GroEL (HSP60 family)